MFLSLVLPMDYSAPPLAAAFLLFALSVLTATPAHAQDAGELAGDWSGAIEVPGQRIGVVFHLSASDDGDLTATLDVPQQGASGIPVNTVETTGDSLRLEVGAIGGVFEGALAGDGTAEGTWRQNGGTFPLVLTRGAPEDASEQAQTAPPRPQEPEPPFPYDTEDVTFPGGMGAATLAGTLTLPRGDGPHPAVVLVSGSGPQDRNEETKGTGIRHKPFLVLADYLTRHGIAVLRYDDRGVAESTGDFSQATMHTFASDARAALSYLKGRDELNLSSFGLVGHSEGGAIAPMVAAHHPGEVDFAVLLAGTAVPGDEIIAEQVERLALAQGLPAEAAAEQRAVQERLLAAVTEAPDSAAAAEAAAALLEEAGRPPAQARQAVAALTSPWYRGFVSYDPRPTLREVRIPVLALFGGKDTQVAAAQNAGPMREALAENPDATVRVFDGLNHLFQPAETGAVSEYAQIETTLAPQVLDAIASWIAERPPAGR